MSDKEPRRRKKRKDSQKKVHFSDDIRADDQIFMASKPETKDSDQETEEEIVMPTYQPSVFAKFVFIILFSCLVLSMSFIFISLRGVDRGAVNIFDDHLEEHHKEEHDVSHDDGHSEEETWSLPEALQESFSDMLPGIGSILSFNDEHVKETEASVLDEDIKDGIKDHEAFEFSEESSEVESVPSSEQESTYEVEDTSHTVEELITPEVYTESILENVDTVQDQISENIYQEPEHIQTQVPKSALQEQKFESFSEEQDFSESSQNVKDQFDLSTPSAISHTIQTESISDSVTDTEEFTSSVLEPMVEGNVFDEENTFTEPVSEITEDAAFPFYEKADITNEDDFKIKEELDELDAVLEKQQQDFLDDDDDDYEGEDGTEDEFDFWQF